MFFKLKTNQSSALKKELLFIGGTTYFCGRILFAVCVEVFLPFF